MDSTVTYNATFTNRKAFIKPLKQLTAYLKLKVDSRSGDDEKSAKDRLKGITGVRGELIHIEILQAQKERRYASASEAKHSEVQEVLLFKLPSDCKPFLVLSVPDPFA